MMISNISLNLQWFERLLQRLSGPRNTEIVSCAISVHVFGWKMLQSLAYFLLAVINVASEHLSVDSGKLVSTVFILINSDPEKTFCGAISIQFNVSILNFLFMKSSAQFFIIVDLACTVCTKQHKCALECEFATT